MRKTCQNFQVYIPPTWGVAGILYEQQQGWLFQQIPFLCDYSKAQKLEFFVSLLILKVGLLHSVSVTPISLTMNYNSEWKLFLMHLSI